MDKQLYTEPRPRPLRTASCLDAIRLRNRRYRYLEQHPTYFENLEHELADPVLYERLVRRFQTASERQAEGTKKGYSRILEGDLLRGEATLVQLPPHPQRGVQAPDRCGIRNHGRDDDGDKDQGAQTREEGLVRWVGFLRERFIRGDDVDFDYSIVDSDESLDVLEQQDAEEAWFDDEEPQWASDRYGGTIGETGEQDF